MPGIEGESVFGYCPVPEPALRPWHPPDGLAGVRPVGQRREALFTDGHWHPVTVRAQGRCGQGWAVLLEYGTDDTRH
jgi:hypothetical protein